MFRYRQHKALMKKLMALQEKYKFKCDPIFNGTLQLGVNQKQATKINKSYKLEGMIKKCDKDEVDSSSATSGSNLTFKIKAEPLNHLLTAKH